MDKNIRIFIFGDSFAENLFKIYAEQIKRNFKHPHPLKEYILDLRNEEIEDPLWFSDWLENWGYEVHNLGIGGTDNQTILEQFYKLEEYGYKEGDRIILWLSSFTRYQWFDQRGNRDTIIPNGSPYSPDQVEINNLLWSQCINREMSLKKNYIKHNSLSHINYFLNLHEKYDPITISFCSNVKNAFKNEKWFFNFETIMKTDFMKFGQQIEKSIITETNGVINDGHYGRETNYYYAIIFDEIIKSGLNGNYSLNLELLNKIKNRIENNKIQFKIPQKWRENAAKKISPNLI